MVPAMPKREMNKLERPGVTNARRAGTTRVAPSAAVSRLVLSTPTPAKATPTPMPIPGSLSRRPAPSTLRCGRLLSSSFFASTPILSATHTDGHCPVLCCPFPGSGLSRSSAPDRPPSPRCSPAGYPQLPGSLPPARLLPQSSHAIPGGISANLWYTASASLLGGYWLGTVYPIPSRLARSIIFPCYLRYYPS